MNNNCIDLSLLPKTSKGINWNLSVNKDVNFCYRGTHDTFKILESIDYRYVLIDFRGRQYKILKDSIKSCSLGILFGFSVTNNYKYQVGDKIEGDSFNLLVLQQLRISTNYNTRTCKGYKLKCLKCGNIFETREGNLDKGDRCPFCSNHKIKIGFNDLWTTRPDIACLLSNPEDGYLYSEFSNKKVRMKCNLCGKEVGYKCICDVSLRGFSCPSCSDGISFPNKFMYHLLDTIGVNFNTEFGYEWCIFPSYKDRNKISHGLYDFVLPDYKMLIEMDSSLGHGEIIYSNSNQSVEESIYRDQMKNALAVQHGYKLVRIDCKYTDNNRFIACKTGILNSSLSEIFDFSHIDWDNIYKMCLNSFLIQSCELFNSGYKMFQIADKLHLNRTTVLDYLNEGAALGLCDYKPKIYKKRKNNNSIKGI